MRLSTLLPVFALSLAACGGGGGDGGGTNPPPSDVVNSVSLSRTNATMRPTEVITVTATARNSSGATVSGKTVQWTVTQTGTIVNIAPSGASVQITAAAVGTAQVTATIEGKTASVAVVVTNQPFPTTAAIQVTNNAFSPATADVGTGAVVTWTWAQGAVEHNVNFTGPAGITAIGNRSTGSESRTFSVAGTYDFSCSIHAGMSGSLTVH